MRHGSLALALGLHMHQPPGNLRLLAETAPYEAERIIRCYDRVQRFAHRHPHAGRIHVGFSGALLDQLTDPLVTERVRPWVDVAAMLDGYRTAPNIEILGMAHFHPILPLIPSEDWEEQIRRGREAVSRVFGHAPAGFWPPEMAFAMELIPVLARAGYRYAVVDGVHVAPQSGGSDLFRPYRATFGGASIIVIPRDRALSMAQESGMEIDWFVAEAGARAGHAAPIGGEHLLTTWSDGENGAWFRELHEPAGFFGRFWDPMITGIEEGRVPIRPVLLRDFIEDQPPTDEAFVRTGTWVLGTTGFDVTPWGGLEVQRRAIEAISHVSGRYHHLASRRDQMSEAGRAALDRAHAMILEGETSCFLVWGDRWVHRLYERISPAEALLQEAEASLQPGGGR